MSVAASGLGLHELRELALQRHVVAHVELLDGGARQAGENGDQSQFALGLVDRDFLCRKHVGDLWSMKRNRLDLLAIVLDRIAQLSSVVWVMVNALAWL